MAEIILKPIDSKSSNTDPMITHNQIVPVLFDGTGNSMAVLIFFKPSSLQTNFSV
jgi:hypothetical protein